MTFYELEKICKQRRLRRRVFFILFIILLLIVIYGIYILYKINSGEIKSEKKVKTDFRKNINKPVTENKKIKIKKEQKNSKVLLENNKSVKPSKEIILTPVISLNFTEINTSDVNSQEDSKKVLSKNSVPSNKPIDKNVVITTEILPSYDECIYQAEDALKNKNYSLALKWAKNANTRNKTRPEAWIISAKILYLKGKKQKAVNILKLYLKYNKNKKIEQFLRKLKNEK